MDRDMNTQEAEAKKRDKKKLLLLLLLLLLVGIAVFFLMFYRSREDKTAWLMKELKTLSEDTIEINDTIVITETITINGQKTLTGTGTIIYKPETSQKMKFESYRIPENECQALEIADLSQADTMFEVLEGSGLTITGSLTLNADNKSLCVKVDESGQLTISESAILKNGLGANILSDGDLSVTGGKIQADEGYNVMSNGTMVVVNGEIIGSGKQMMNIVADGTVDIKGGTISKAKGTNIYLLNGELSISGGTIDSAAVDNVFVERGNIKVTEGVFSAGTHGVHNMGTAVVTGGTYDNNTNQIYNEGIATVNDLSFGNSLGHNIVNTGKNTQMQMENIVIESATTHGVYNVRGAKLDAENLTVKSALSKGVHNGGGYFTGKNITIVRAQGAGVGNDTEKGWTKDGEVTIDGLQILKASYHNLLNTNGVMTINNAELGLIAANSVQVTGGTLNMKNVDLKGTTGNGTYHTIYMLGGVVNAENINIDRSVSRGIQNRGGEFNGKNITISNVSGTAVGNQANVDGITNGKITINGLKISETAGYSVQNSDDGTITISNGLIEVSNRTAVYSGNGAINLTDVKITGVTSKEEAKTEYNGITVSDGKVTLKNVSINDMLSRGISNEKGIVVGSNITINGTGGTGIANLEGTMRLENVTTENVTGFNIDVRGGSASISEGTLNINKTANSVRLQNGALSLNNILIAGTPAVTGTDGGVTKYYGIGALEGTLVLNDVTIQNTAGRGLNNRGADITGNDITVKNAGGTSVCNEDGTMDLTGIVIMKGSGYNLDVRAGNVKISDSVLDFSQNANVYMRGGTLTLNDTLVDGTAMVTADDGTTKVYEGITAKAGEVYLNNVTVRDTSGRNLSNTGATLIGTNVTLENAQKATSFYNTASSTISNLTVVGNQIGYNVDNKGYLKVENGKFSKTTTTNLYLENDSTTVLNNVVVEGTTKNNAVMVRKDATLDFDGLTINDSSARALTNGNSSSKLAGGTITGKNLTIINATTTSLANDSGTMDIDGLKIEGAKANAINIKDGSVVLNNAFVGIVNETAIVLEKGELQLLNASLEGTTKANAITQNAGTLYLENVEISNAYERSLNLTAGEMTGKNITIQNSGIGAGAATSVRAGKNSVVKIDGLMILNGTAYAIDNLGSMELTNVKMSNGKNKVINNQSSGIISLDAYEISDNTEVAIANAGQVELGSGKIDAGAYNAIVITGGKVTLNGKADITTNGYAVSLSTSGDFYMGPGATLVSAAGIYLPKGNTLKLLGNGIGNTTDQKIKLNPAVTNEGTVYVETESKDVAKDLELANIFTVLNVSVVADGKKLVAAEAKEIKFDDEAKTISVSTWAELKKVIESAEEGNNLKVILTNNIENTDEGVIKQGEDVRVKVTLTDEGKGYTITRTDLQNALFMVNRGSEMTLDGKITLDGASSSSSKAQEAILLNKGTLTINSQVTVKGGYKNSGANALDTSRTNGSGGAIENVGILNLYGTVTTSYSGNGSAISSLGGTVTITGAHLNNNIGRAIRIMAGEAVITDTEINYNGNVSGGGAVLIDSAEVSIMNSFINHNVSTGSGGAIQTTAADSILYMSSCEINNNTSSTDGGGINIIGKNAKNITLEGCTISGNLAKNGHGGGIFTAESTTVLLKQCIVSNNECKGTNKQGGGIYINNNSAMLTLEDCTLKNNTASQAGGGIRLGNDATLTLTGKTEVKDNTGTLGTQIWANNENSTINWGSDVVMSVTKTDSTNYTLGMIGLNKAGVKINLTGEMNDSNNISVSGSINVLVVGNTILSGYDTDNENAEMNSWIKNAADNFTIVKPTELKVGTDGKVAAIEPDEGEFDNETTSISVSTWAELKSAIENAEEGENLEIILNGNIETTSEGAITVNGVKVTLTDKEKDYTIIRTDLKNALFLIESGSEMSLDGKITLDGASSSSTKAQEAVLLNKGTLTINSGVTVKNGYKSGANNSIDGSGKSAGAIESKGTLNMNGTVTASGSGNYSAISVLSGVFTANGAKLYDNPGRAVRIASGSAQFTNVEMYKNINTVGSISGGALLIDGGSVEISGGQISQNQASSEGAAVYIQSTATLKITDCILNENKSVGNGGVILSNTSGKVEFIRCTINGNGVSGSSKNGGAIYVKGSGEMILTDCKIDGNYCSIGNGGAFYIDNASANVTVTGGSISNNTVSARGGAVRIDNGTIRITNCTINNNTGTTSGGAFFINKYSGHHGKVYLTSCTLNENSSNGSGKTIHVKGTLSLKGCIINNVSSVNADSTQIYLDSSDGSPTVTNEE